MAASTTPHSPTGVIAGQVLQLARRSAGLSQEALAELLDVSLDTLQGWESGRRRLPATRIEALVEVRHELVAAGADHQVVAALEPALDADWLIGRTLEARGRAHPLAVLVTTRQVHDLLVWALTGHRPSWLLGHHAGAGNGRPGLGAPERRAMFARLRELAEGADSRREEGTQLRRQATFLAAYDPASDTDAWLASQPAANPQPGAWSPEWVAARSRAVTEAARGNPERLRWFIDRAGRSHHPGPPATTAQPPVGHHSQAKARAEPRDDRRQMAGQNPGAGQDAPGRRRRRPSALAAVAGAGRDLLCRCRAWPIPAGRPSGRPQRL